MAAMNLSTQQRLSFLLGPLLMLIGTVVAAVLGARLLQKSYVAFAAVCIGGGFLGQTVGSWLGILIPRFTDPGKVFRVLSVVIALAGVPFALLGARDVYDIVDLRQWEPLTSAAFSGLAALMLFAVSGQVGTKLGLLASSFLTALAIAGTAFGGRFVADLPVLISALAVTGIFAILLLKGRAQII